MAVTFTELTECFDSANTTSYPTNSGTATATAATYTPSANTPCIAVVNVAGSVAAAPTFAGNGMTWTLGASAATWGSGSVHRLYVFTAPGIASPTTTAGTFTCASDAGTGCLIHVVQVNGAHASTPFTQHKARANPTPGTTVNRLLTFDSSTAADCAIFAANVDVGAAGASPIPPSYVSMANFGHGTPQVTMSNGYHLSPGATTTVDWSASSTQWGILGVEIKPGSTSLTGALFTAAPTFFTGGTAAPGIPYILMAQRRAP